MALQTVLGSGEMTITENWDILKIITTKEKAENINVGDTIEYVPSWSEYKLSDLDRQMYDKGFRYKKILVAKNNEAVQLVNELLPVTLDTATPISEGKMRNDCGDLRFYWWNEDSQAWEELSYWIDQDTVNSSSTKVILRIPKVSSSGYVNIVAYYGAKHYGRKDDLTIGFGNRSNEGKVLSFDGEDDYVRVSYSDALNLTQFTLVVLVKPDDVIDIHSLIARGGTPATRNYFILIGNKKALVGFTDDGGHYFDIASTSSLVAGNEYLIAETYDGNNLKLYLNGVLENSAQRGITTPDNEDLYIGRASWTSDYYLNGKIYLVLIYNRALSDDEIQAIYENPNDPPRAGLVLWLAPDSVDDVNGKWLDKSGLGNDGTINGATPVEVRTFEESVQTSKVMSFDGEDDYVEVVDSASLDITDAITIEAWVKINGWSYGGIVAKSGGSWNGWILRIHQTSHVVQWDTFDGSSDQMLSGSTQLNLGEWYHIVATYEPSLSSDNQKIFLNGNLDGSRTYTGGLTSIDRPVNVGRYIGPGNNKEYFNGLIGKVRVYNRALSDTEIQNLYNDPNNPPLDGLVLWLDGTSIDETNGKWLNKAPALKSGYVEPLDGVIYGATPTDLLSSAWSEEIDMNNGLRIVWRGKVVKKVESGGSVVLYIRTNNLGKLIGEVV